MSIHEKIDQSVAVPTAAPELQSRMRAEKRSADLQLWFDLAQDDYWILMGKAAAGFVALASVGVLGAIIYTVAA